MHPLYNADRDAARQIQARRQQAAIIARQKLLEQLKAENERLIERIEKVHAELQRITAGL